jgi:sulfur carrier protein
MTLIVAGTPKEYPDGINLTRLIELEKVETPMYVTVALNDAFVESGGFEAAVLKDGDKVEFLYFMGGGC